MIVISNKTGQLGNRLFAFAHVIAAAEAHQLKIINLSFDEYAQYFEATSKDIFCRYPRRKSFIRSNKIRSWLFILNKIILKILRLVNFHESAVHKIITADLPEYHFSLPLYYDLNSSTFLADAQNKKVVFLFGRFFMDYDNLEKFHASVRSYFKPTEEIQVDVEKIFTLAKRNSELVVGVQIRRGDYQFFVDGKYFYSIEQYKTKMLELNYSMANRKVTFVVCSNEEIEEAAFLPLQVIKGPGHVVKDMYLLAKCDYIMGPPSTYTLWASFYGNKPLYQLRSIAEQARPKSFEVHPPTVLYNFSSIPSQCIFDP